VHATPYEFKRNLDYTLVSTGIGLSLFAYTSDKQKQGISENEYSQLNKNNVNRIDRALMFPFNQTAARISDVLVFSSLATPLVQLRKQAEYSLIALMYAESVLLSTGLNQVSKARVERPRPYMYDTGTNTELVFNKDSMRSFFSAHATTISNSLVFASKVYLDLNPNYPYQTRLWIFTGSVIATGAALRVIAGYHFVTDVVIGVVVGSIIGYQIPQLHKKSNQKTVSYLPFMTSEAVGINFQYRF